MNATAMLIKKYEMDYIRFMGIECLPEYRVTTKEIDLAVADSQGFSAPATAWYDRATGKHTLEVWPTGLRIEGAPLIFHEFTHMLDAEKYVGKSDIKYIANKGFTEYHASQVDLLKRLGAKNISSPISFSMKDPVEHLNQRITVEEFVRAAHSTACELINRADFPSNIQTLSATMGLIFNYLGRRSICIMYASDYTDSFDDSLFSKLIGTAPYSLIKNLMNRWLDDQTVDVIDGLFFKLISALIQAYQL